MDTDFPLRVIKGNMFYTSVYRQHKSYTYKKKDNCKINSVVQVHLQR